MPRSKNEWNYNSAPQYAFMAWCLVKHRDNFAFYLYLVMYCCKSSIFSSLFAYFPEYSRDSSVSIASDYELDDWKIGVRILRGLGIFLFDTASRPALGPTQPHLQKVPGTFSLGIKHPGREADHSSTSSAEVKECVTL
jgi:hypothetical protein